MARSNTIQSGTQVRFLIIGYGDKLRGDDAVGLRVAEIVASWHLPSVQSLAVPQLTPELVNDIAASDYVIFVDACSRSSGSSTLQLDPIVIGGCSSRTLAVKEKETHCYDPLSLLELTQQLHNRAPQAWFLKVPIESLEVGEELSSTTERGCDRAVRTIEQFISHYGPPVRIEQTQSNSIGNI